MRLCGVRAEAKLATMKILVGSSDPDHSPGGISAFMMALCSSLTEQGHTVILAAPPPASAEWCSIYGITFIPTPRNERGEDLGRVLYRAVIDLGIEGIINNDNPYLQSLAPCVPCPFISVAHMAFRTIASLACHNLAWSDYIVSLSHDSVKHFAEHFHVPIEKLVQIPTFLPANESPTLTTDLSNGLAALFVGGSCRLVKGASDVLLLAQMALEDGLPIRFHWCGDMTAAFASKLAGLSNVQAHGKVPRATLDEIAGRCHCFLQPSYTEECSMAFIEALRRGLLPIVKDSRGEHRYAVQPGIDGFILPATNWPRHCKAVLRVLANDQKRLFAMRCAALRNFEARFSAQTVAQQYVMLLSRPTIERSRTDRMFRALSWHRKPGGNSLRGFINRVRYRAGILQHGSIVQLKNEQ